MFLGLLDPEPDPLIRGMDPDPSVTKRKYSKKNLDSYTALRLLFDFLSLKNYVYVPSSSKTKQQKMFFVGILKVIYENSRIWIRIHTTMSSIRNTAFYSIYCSGAARFVSCWPHPAHSETTRISARSSGSSASTKTGVNTRSSAARGFKGTTLRGRRLASRKQRFSFQGLRLLRIRLRVEQIKT
jgi:hypothetical protein